MSCRFYVGNEIRTAPTLVPPCTMIRALEDGEVLEVTISALDGKMVLHVPRDNGLTFETPVKVSHVRCVDPLEPVDARRVRVLRAVGKKLLAAWTDERQQRLDADKRFGEVKMALEGVPVNPAWCDAAQFVAQFVAGERFVGEITVG